MTLHCTHKSRVSSTVDVSQNRHTV